MRLHWLVLLVIAGCRRDEVEKPEDVRQFSLTVAGPSVAGEPVVWAATLVDGDGAPLPVEVTLSSDLEPALTWDASSLSPTLAGLHAVTAIGVGEDGSYEATVPLDVSAAAAVSVDLQLGANQAAAGEPLGFTVVAVDTFGNAVSGAVVTADSADLAVVAPNVVSTVPGIYTLTAAVDAVTDVETLRVVPGEPAELVLSLSDTALEVFETTTATATAYDVYGNEVAVDWDLSVETVGSTTVSGRNVTFLSEGWFTVWARYDGLEDSVGPLLIDSSGPTVVLDSPDRGTFTEDASTTVSGLAVDDYSGVTSLTVNGDPVSVDGSGAFTTTVDNVFGLNILETEAVDGDGNPTTDTRARLAGDFLSYGSAAGDGVVARINESGFDTLESLGEGLIGGTDLSGMLPSPAYSTSSESCIDVIFDTICITWYSIDLYVTNPYIGATDLEIDPDAGGWLNTTFTVYDPSIDWAADGTVLGIGMSADGQIYADNISVDMDLQPYVDAGVLGVNVLAVDVSSAGFTFDWDSWIYDVMDFFGLDLSSLIEDAMVDAVEGLISDEVPALVGDVVGDLEIATDLEIDGGTYTFDATPSSVSVDDLGLTLGLATSFTTAAWVHSESGPGSLYGDYSVPLYASATPGMQASLSLDFLNQALYAFWGGGLLDRTLTEQDLGLDLGSLSTFLPFSSLSIQTEALLPPVIVPGTGDSLLDLQLGDLALTLYNGDPADDDIVFQVYLSVIAGLELDVTDGMLAPALGDTQIWFDVVVPSAGTEASADAEALLGALVPMLLPTLTEGLGALPIPDIEGFGLDVASIALDGPESGYVTVGGDLSVE